MNDYPKIGYKLVLTSYQDLDMAVYGRLKNIPCDETRFRRTSEVDHPVYNTDSDGKFIVWKGTEYIIISRPVPCLAIEEAFERLYQNIEPYVFLIDRLRREYQLCVSIIFCILLDNDLSYPEMVVTKRIVHFASKIDAEIQIWCDVDEDIGPQEGGSFDNFSRG